MNDAELLEEFSLILRGLLLDDGIRLEMTTTRDDVDDWDSFNYVNFVVAIEMQHDIKFKVSDVESFATVGDIVLATQELLAAG